MVYICHTNDKIIITMIYSVSSYQKEFHPNKSVRTVHRLIKSGFLPLGHTRIIMPKCILVETDTLKNYEPYILAVRDYMNAKKIPVDFELSTKFGIMHDVDSIRFLNEILGNQ